MGRFRQEFQKLWLFINGVDLRDLVVVREAWQVDWSFRLSFQGFLSIFGLNLELCSLNQKSRLFGLDRDFRP